MSVRSSPAACLQRIADHVRVVHDEAARYALFEELAASAEPRVVSFANAHAVNLACTDNAFCEALVASDVLLRDGTGMRFLYNTLRREAGINMNGTDFIPELLNRFGDAPVALCGTKEPYLSQAADSLAKNVVLKLDGFQDIDVYPKVVAESGARVVVLAMGMPKQERVALRLRSELNGGVIIVNGGAILDFLAGRFPRAPQWMRSIGMEWVFRLAREPRRLASRYVIGNPLFLWRVARLGLRRPA